MAAVVAILKIYFFSSPEQHSQRAIILPSVAELVLALASGSINVKVFVKVFKTSLFPNLITDLIQLWYDDTVKAVAAGGVNGLFFWVPKGTHVDKQFCMYV